MHKTGNIAGYKQSTKQAKKRAKNRRHKNRPQTEKTGASDISKYKTGIKQG